MNTPTVNTPTADFPAVIAYRGSLYCLTSRRGISRAAGEVVAEYENADGLRLWATREARITESDE